MIVKTQSIKWVVQNPSSDPFASVIRKTEPACTTLILDVTQVKIIATTDDPAEAWALYRWDCEELHSMTQPVDPDTLPAAERDRRLDHPITLLSVTAPQYAEKPRSTCGILVDRAWLMNDRGDTVDRLAG